MSDGPDWELQTAIVARLKADTALQALIGNPIRLHQDVPDVPTFPYVTIGDGQNVPDQVQFMDSSEVFVDLHVWSRAAGFAEAKRIAATIEASLNDADLSLTSNRCVEIERAGNRSLRDPDGVTKHVVVTLQAWTEPA